ncbi:hypothetical protein AVEN_12881-1 [Araneus ventricosus]|uniref:CCHC-type domain-containing protein n=1 Tax=Araneus ventricosus TaxID=182803 RepID=A0A4Y2HKD3_ARAVE|nr:hypothetical protein AVEN_12881-1 [Araneus ventricosus]
MGKKKNRPFSGQQIEFNLLAPHNFPTFFIMHRESSDKETFHGVSPFLIEKAISGALGEVKSTKKLRSGDLLVEVNSPTQAKKILNVKTLSTIAVAVTPHATLNSSKGVISCGDLLNDPIENITKELSNQGVTHVRRITIRRNGQLLNTKHLVLTFSSAKLPEYIKAGYMRLSVRAYIPNLLRCFNCQLFGHSKLAYRGTLTCARCAEVGHDSTDCTAKEKCINCKGNHTSFSRDCSAWKQEKEIITTKSFGTPHHGKFQTLQCCKIKFQIPDVTRTSSQLLTLVSAPEFKGALSSVRTRELHSLDPDTEMRTSSSSEDDILEYEMSEELEETSSDSVCTPSAPRPKKYIIPTKYKQKLCFYDMVPTEGTGFSFPHMISLGIQVRRHLSPRSPRREGSHRLWKLPASAFTMVLIGTYTLGVTLGDSDHP